MADAISVLVVEDEGHIRNLLQYNLRQDGFNVSTAEDGIVGLKKARELKPQLILLDVMMPGMTGLQVLQELKKDDQMKTTPIFMLTARTMMSDIEDAFKLGADDYITKPFDPIKLGALIKMKLEKLGPRSS